MQTYHGTGQLMGRPYSISGVEALSRPIMNALGFDNVLLPWCFSKRILYLPYN